MRLVAAILTTLMLPAAALANPTLETYKYAINRNGEQIGTHTIELMRNGQETLVNISTRVEVKIMLITAYRFEQDESERWITGRLVSLNAVTNDNGTYHKLEVGQKGSVLQVDADGKATQADGSVIPNSLWNTSLLRQAVTLNIRDGSVAHISVVDDGVEDVMVRGEPAKAHHYAIQGPFPEDVWYDEQGHLIQAQFYGSDGSTIFYQLI